MKVIALDIGGTKIFAGRYDAQRHLEEATKLPTKADKDVNTTLAQILSAITTVRTEEVTAIGIAWAGFVDPATGTIIKAPNIPALDGFALTDFITAQTGLPCILENDARCFALGEYLACSPTPQVCLGLIIGTGVGSGVVIDGKLMQGAHAAAGEVGHFPYQGQEIEDWIAGPGLQRYFGIERLSNLNAPKPEMLEAPMQALTDWLFMLLLAYDPDQIVIGGGAGKHFWRHHQTEIMDILNKKSDQYPIDFKLRFSTRENAGAEGAACLAQSIS